MTGSLIGPLADGRGVGGQDGTSGGSSSEQLASLKAAGIWSICKATSMWHKLCSNNNTNSKQSEENYCALQRAMLFVNRSHVSHHCNDISNNVQNTCFRRILQA